MEIQVIMNFLIVALFAIIGLIVIICWRAITISTKEAISKNPISLETIPEQFEKIYAELYHNHIHSLETMRKKIKRKYMLDIICFSSSVIFVSIGGNTKESIFMILGLIFLGISVSFFSKDTKHDKEYKETYKKEIISNFIKLVNNQLEYIPIDTKETRTQEYYEQAKFDYREFNRFYSDDYIKGVLEEGTFIEMCDLHIQNVSGSGKKRRVIDIFQGIFAHTSCNKDIGTYVKIITNKLEILEKQKKVEMDSAEFEKYFDVYSENNIVAMQLLTSDIMEILIDFHKKYGIYYEIVFKGNSIYTRFFTGAMFEPTVFGESMDKGELFRYYCLLKFVIDVIQKVNKIKQELEV